MIVAVIDLDPEERDDIERVIAQAKQENAYLHIEVRRDQTSADMLIYGNDQEEDADAAH